MRSRFLPEGRLLHTSENEAACASCDGLRRAMEEGTVLEGVAQLCDGAHNLLVSVGPFTGFLPREEAALGIAEGTTREIAILSRVGKPVCFQITALEESGGVLRPRLSRRRAQQAALDAMLAGLHPGCILPAVVTHLESFGAFVDIGCGVPSLIGIENISVSRIPHPDQRFRVGQAIFAVVQELDPKLGRVYLTHRELLGTWEENAAAFCAGDTVPGIVRSVEDYGIFIELTPNLAGLAEPRPGVYPGQRATVTIKSLNPTRMKVKLILIDSFDQPGAPREMSYFVQGDHIDRWEYSPAACVRKIVTDFSAVRAQ